MNRETFLNSFAHVADAPGGIDTLRRLILDLAVRGRLTHQDPNDTPAGELLKRMSVERDRVVKAKEIAKRRELPQVPADNRPFLPNGWRWVRFGELFSRMGAGSTPAGGEKSYVKQGVIFIRSQNVYNSGLVLEGVARIPEATHEKMSGTKVFGGDILLNITGASIGRTAIVPREGWTTANVNQHVSVLRPVIHETTEYLHLMMTSPYFQRLIAGSSPGASREGLAIKRMELFPIPLPPIAEQHRIAKRVDELMGLCDELDAQQAARFEARTALTSATLHRLSRAEPADDLREARAAFADNIDIHLAPGDGDLAALKQLRQTILDLAVRGRLTHQDPNDTPAGELLKRMSVERDRVVKAKEIAKRRELPQVPADNRPFLPNGWRWVRFGELFSRMGAGSTPAGGEKSYVKQGVIFIRSQNVYNSGLVLEGVARIPEATHEKMSGTKVFGGDILLNITGASIGRTAIVPREGWTTANVNQHVSVLRPVIHETTEYLHLMMTSPYFQRLIAGSSPGASREGLAIKRMELFPIPLPPIAEQHRIAKRVDELMGLCDELDAQLLHGESRRRGLSASVAAHAVAVGG